MPDPSSHAHANCRTSYPKRYYLKIVIGTYVVIQGGKIDILIASNALALGCSPRAENIQERRRLFEHQVAHLFFCSYDENYNKIGTYLMTHHDHAAFCITCSVLGFEVRQKTSKITRQTGGRTIAEPKI